MKPIADATDRDAWVAARRSFLGASDVATVLGLNPWDTPIDVWATKLELIPPKQPTLPMRLGIAFEQAAADEWQALNPGYTLRHDPTTYAHDDHPWLAMTPDRFADAWDDGGLVECKNVWPRTAPNWRDDNGKPIVPMWVRTQCQVQMAVSGLPWVDVVAILHDGPDVLVKRVERDQADIDFIIDYCGTWWQRHVVGKERPTELLGRPEKVKASLDRLWPDGEGAVRLPYDAVELIAKLKRDQNQLKSLESDIKHTSNQLRNLLGDASDGYIDDNAKPAVTWRTQTRKGHDLAPIIQGRVDELMCTDDELAVARRLIAACETTSSFRVLRVS